MIRTLVRRFASPAWDHWLRPRPAPAAAKEIAEDIAENIAHICAAEIEAAESAGSAGSSLLKGRVAKLVVLSSLLRIAENRVRLGSLP